MSSIKLFPIPSTTLSEIFLLQKYESVIMVSDTVIGVYYYDYYPANLHREFKKEKL